MPCERKHVEAILGRIADLEMRLHTPSREPVADLVSALYEAAESALAACDDSPWRSMESAPKDGASRFLAVVNGRVRVVAWAKTSHVPMWGWCLVDQGPEDCDLCDPTHWMPLPAAPESTAPTGGAESKEW